MLSKYDTLKTKLERIITDSYGAAKDKTINKMIQAIDQHVKAYGDCGNCYGKGYATVRDGIIGYPDFGNDGFKSPITTKMKFCDCDRGKQLENLIGEEITNG